MCCTPHPWCVHMSGSARQCQDVHTRPRQVSVHALVCVRLPLSAWTIGALVFECTSVVRRSERRDSNGHKEERRGNMRGTCARSKRSTGNRREATGAAGERCTVHLTITTPCSYARREKIRDWRVSHLQHVNTACICGNSVGRSSLALENPDFFVFAAAPKPLAAGKRGPVRDGAGDAQESGERGWWSCVNAYVCVHSDC